MCSLYCKSFNVALSRRLRYIAAGIERPFVLCSLFKKVLKAIGVETMAFVKWILAMLLVACAVTAGTGEEGKATICKKNLFFSLFLLL